MVMPKRAAQSRQTDVRRSARRTCQPPGLVRAGHEVSPNPATGPPQMDKAKRAADMLSGALSLLGEDADSAEARGRLGLPPADGAFGEEEPGSVVQRAMQQVAPRLARHAGRACLT